MTYDLSKLHAAVSFIEAARLYSKVYGYLDHTYPPKGTYVMTDLIASADNTILRRLGFCVQIRPRQGFAGSDLWLLRHPDGSLCQHSNQRFYTLTSNAVKAIKPLFEEDVTPEKEDYSHGYDLGDRGYELGYIVSPNVSMHERLAQVS